MKATEEVGAFIEMSQLYHNNELDRNSDGTMEIKIKSVPEI